MFPRCAAAGICSVDHEYFSAKITKNVHAVTPYWKFIFFVSKCSLYYTVF
jgi:hypothetical protein